MTALSSAEQLLALARAYSKATGLTLGTVGKRACGGNHHFFNRLAKGRGANTESVARAAKWFLENWPDNAAWPKWMLGKPNFRTNYLREWRLRAELSQAYVEKTLGWPGSRVSHLENNRARITKTVLQVLAPLYGCQPDDLLRPVLPDEMRGKLRSPVRLYQGEGMPKLLPDEESTFFEVTSVHGQLELARLRVDCVVDWQFALQTVQMIRAELSKGRATGERLKNDIAGFAKTTLANDGKEGPE